MSSFRYPDLIYQLIEFKKPEFPKQKLNAHEKHTVNKQLTSLAENREKKKKKQKKNTATDLLTEWNGNVDRN